MRLRGGGLGCAAAMAGTTSCARSVHRLGQFMHSAIVSLLVLAKAFLPMQFNGNQERGNRMNGDHLT